MAEIALLSNQSSSLYASSTSSGGADQSSYIYDMKQSGVNKFTEKFIRTPINSPTFGGNCQVEIPAFGILKQLVLKTTIEYTLNTAASTPLIAKALFAELIDQVALKNSSRELQVVYGDCIKYLVYNLGASESKKWRIVGKDDLFLADPNALTASADTAIRPRNRYGDVKTAVGTHTIDIYTILPFSMFPKFGSDHATPMKNLFNTRFMERISLDIKYNPRVKVLVGGAANNAGAAQAFSTEPTIKSAELISQFDIIQSKSLAAIEAANYSLSQPLAMVLGNWNKHRNTFTATAGQNTPEIQLFNTDLCHSMLITCKKVNTESQLFNLTKGINLKSCDSDTANEPCVAFAQYVEGYGDTLTTHKSTARASAQGGADASISAVAQPMPYTNKHSLAHDETQNVTGIGNFGAGLSQALGLGAGVSRPGADHMTISSIKLTSAGRELYRADNHLEALYLGNSDMRGSCWFDDAGGRVGEDADLQDLNGCSQYNMYLVKFGDDDNLDAIRGMLSLKNLNSVKLELTVDNCAAGGTYEVNVFVRKYSAISIEASSGRISTAVST